MTVRRPGARIARLAAACTAAVLGALTVPLVTAAVAPNLSTATAAPVSGSALHMTVSRISPWTPATTNTKRPLTLTVVLRNTGTTDLDNLSLRLSRGSAVARLDTFRSVTAETTLPSDLSDITSTVTPRSIDVPAGGAPVIVTVRTFSGVPYTYPLCLCTNGVYPLYVTADNRDGTVAGFARTSVASVDGADDPHKNPFVKDSVAWVWPLVDRPHRTTDGTVFADDTLRISVGADGRLSRALRVVEDLGPTTPMTLMVDPDLIDELAVMAHGYTYVDAAGHSVTGTGGSVAAAWLARLRQVLADDPLVDLQFTPYADPAIQSLNSAGLSWHTQLPPTMRDRVETALDLSTVPSTLSWPPGGRVDASTLDRIAAGGAASVLLDDASVRPSTVGGLPATSATLSSDQGTVSAALLSGAMQDDVAATTAHQYSNLSQLPHLLAQLALLADDGPSYRRHVAFLAAPRYVDPTPARAEAVIRATTASSFSTPVSVATALGQGTATAASHTHVRHHVRTAAWSLTGTQLAYARRTSRALPTVTSLFGGADATPAAALALAQFPRALQRCESAAWTPASSVGTTAHGTALAGRIRSHVTALAGEVRIVRPASGGYSYSLASTTSPLPVTVENDSPYRASISIALMPANGLPGVTADRVVDKPVAPQSKQTFRIRTHVQRSGRIELFAVLSTADGRHVLGPRVRLSVHSTVLGRIGLIITVAAAAVLIGALGLRYFRRIQRLRRKRRPPAATSRPASPTPAAR